jgi:hypothetical protein
MNTATDTAANTTADSVITITPVEGDELHHQYPGQTAPQPCYVQLVCETGALSASYDAEIGNAVPVGVWHQRVRRWTIPALTESAANALLEEIAPLAERVVAGYSERWDGSNHVGEFDADADDAVEAIARLCDRDWSEGDVIAVWDAADYLGNVGSAEAQARALKVTSTTTDDELDTIAEDVESEASPAVVNGVRKHLGWLREQLRDDATRIVIDEENHAEAWWTAAREAAPSADADVARIFAALDRGTRTEGVVVSSDEADAFSAWAEGLPGWDDGPEYAPTALLFQDA